VCESHRACVWDVGPGARCMDGACNACVVMNGCGCERVWSVALADMVCVYVVLHDAAGGNVCGVSGRGCGDCWLDVRGYVRVSGGRALCESHRACVRDVGPDAGCMDWLCDTCVVTGGVC
jgi:hypothetical protein